MSILMLLTMLLLELSKMTMGLYHKAEQQQDASREARATLQFIASDLRSAVLLDKNKESLSDLYLNVQTHDPSCGSNLFFLTTLPREKRIKEDLGDLHAVGYFLTPTSNTIKSSCYDLYRFVANSNETMTALTQGTLLSLYQKAYTTDSALCEKLASNILKFQVTPGWYYQGQLTKQPPKIQTDPKRSNIPPSFITISITIISNATAKKALKTREAVTTEVETVVVLKSS
ncbi:MAG: hypothetical protein A3F67_08730 [Verrucomicrobia bacterium RIFCSPHIGHO2_12_FULL_41_10]|nr:MAG: hypothetical protein A3F67_08730 [Verrucomicrobia bacterium RIFCSPHIGHO2_12_FULL_41_10]